MAGSETDLKALLRRVVELVMPNLRHYYRVPRKGRIVKSYAADGAYFADVQPLRNDESVDPREPVLPKIEIPVLWGGPERGVVCPPAAGTFCDITYYDGDPNYPRISNFRWAKHKAPACELGAFVIQQRPGVYVKITPEGHLISRTDAGQVSDIGGSRDETIGADWTVEVGGSVSIVATVAATVQAPQINLVGNLSAVGAGGGTGSETKSCDTEQSGSFVLNGPLTVNGPLQVNDNITATGTIFDGGGNSNHHSHP